MLDFRSSTRYRRRRSLRPPFPHILCVVDGAGSEAAIVQAIAVADGDARVTFAGSWYGKGSVERAAASERKAGQAVTSAVHRGREAGLQAGRTLFHTPRLSDVLVRAGQPYDLIVVGAHAHARMTGILLDKTATRLVHRAPVPVLIAREAPLGAG